MPSLIKTDVDVHQPLQEKSIYPAGLSARAPKAWKIEYLGPDAAAELLSHGLKFGICRVEGPLRFKASVLIRVENQGHELVCGGIGIGLLEEPPVRVTATALRLLPLQEILAAVNEKTGWARYRGSWDDSAPGIRVRPAKGYSDEYLRELVRDYRQARTDNPQAPTKTLAAMRNLSPQAIRYQLRLAESRKLLKHKERARTKEHARGGRQ